MTQPDPYTTSQANLTTGGEVSPEVIAPLAKTAGWARLISVLVLIAAGFMVLAAVGMMAFPAMLGEEDADIGTAMGVGMGVMYLIMALFYLIPGVKLWGYASRIRELERSGSQHDLLAALDAQRSFWKFVGVITLIFGVITALAIAASITVPVYNSVTERAKAAAEAAEAVEAPEAVR